MNIMPTVDDYLSPWDGATVVLIDIRPILTIIRWAQRTCQDIEWVLDLCGEDAVLFLCIECFNYFRLSPRNNGDIDTYVCEWMEAAYSDEPTHAGMYDCWPMIQLVDQICGHLYKLVPPHHAHRQLHLNTRTFGDDQFLKMHIGLAEELKELY